MSLTAPNLTSNETTYVKNTFQQYVDTLGLSVTYKVQNASGSDTYGNPAISYTSQSINAIVNELTENEYAFVEPGLLPVHYGSMWEYSVTPQIGDRVDWKGMEFECRNIFPVVAGNTVIYYRIIIRRVLSTGQFGAGTS